MDRRLQKIIEGIERNDQVKVSESLLLDVFKNDFNEQKGETPRWAMNNWLDKGSVIFKFDCQRIDDPYHESVYVFRKLIN